METQEILGFDAGGEMREGPPGWETASNKPLLEQLIGFREFGTETRLTQTEAELFGGGKLTVPTCINEYWTSRQRAASSLHEISYRACFKPQLPRFFIQRLTAARGDRL